MRRLSLLLVALSLLIGCTPSTRLGQIADPREGGIGGTGLAPDEEGGLGGTGVFGTVTGLGSIHLNGLRIATPPGSFAVGDTVAVELMPGTRPLTAQRVEQIRPLRGPIGRVDVARRRIWVMGTPVVLEAGNVVQDVVSGAVVDLAGLMAGEWVEISGLWRLGTVVATRIERVPPIGSAQIAGRLDGTGTARRIGGTALSLECCGDVPPGFVVVQGVYADGRLAAEQLDTGPSSLFGPGARHVVVEAYLAPNPSSPGYHLSGFGIPMDPKSRVSPTVGRRALFIGRLDDSFLIERSVPLPEGMADRRRVLDGLDPSQLLE